MKKIIYTITLLTLSLFIGSCEEEFLTDAAKPTDRLGGNDFYDSPDKIKGGVFAIYRELYDLYARDNLLTAYINISDNGSREGGVDGVNNFVKVTSDNIVLSKVENIWRIGYKIISKSNLIEAAIEDGFPAWQENDGLRRSMGEVRFMRAFAYFHLVLLFGDVPLIVDQPTTLEEAGAFTRETVNRIYEEIIIPDLEFASQNCFLKSQLAGLNELGSAPRGAAKTLLAEAYLFRERPADAEAVLEEVVASGEYSLLPDFNDLWGGNDNNAESIFEIQFNFGATGQSNDYTRLLPFTLQGIGGFQFTTGVSVPTVDLMETMVNENDTRYTATLDSGLFDPEQDLFVNGLHWRKYTDFSIGAGAIENDWNINLLRYADVLHLLAEAEIQQGKIAEGIDHVNETRARANMPLFGTGVSQEMALDLYLHERRMEFAGEMKRWRDLLRTNKQVEVMEAFLDRSIAETQYLWPIPPGEIEANPDGITQNPGY